MLSILTGFNLIHSRMMSCTNERGAFVLSDPATAWEREMVNPALRRAELRVKGRQQKRRKRKAERTHATTVRGGEVQWKKLATRVGVK